MYEAAPRTGRPRLHVGPEPASLNDYRTRYALYKSDPDLQKAHALFPWIVTWDDHEVDNNYANDKAEDGAPRDRFLERRANAYQAYYEHMPLRRSSLPHGSSLRLYRRLTFGDLAEFSVLDTRQYRSDQPCGDGNKPQCAEALAPGQTMMGAEQEQWFFDGETFARTVEYRRATSDDGQGGPARRTRAGVFDGPVERIRSSPQPCPAVFCTNAEAIEPGGDHRRHPFELGGRSQARFCRPEVGRRLGQSSSEHRLLPAEMEPIRSRPSRPISRKIRTYASTTISVAMSDAR